MQVAIKEADKKHLKYIIREVKHFQELNNTSPYIVTIMMTKKVEKKYLIIMEYCGGGSLFDFIQQVGRVNEFQASYWFKMIYYGIEALRDASMLHRDLKPENILLVKNSLCSTLKIADFGLSRKVGTNVTVGIGTPLYAAPEVISKQQYDQSVDMWSLGQILYEMLYGKCLYKQAINLSDLMRLQKETTQLLEQSFEEHATEI